MNQAVWFVASLLYNILGFDFFLDFASQHTNQPGGGGGGVFKQTQHMAKSYDRPENVVQEVGVVKYAGLGEGDSRDDHGQLHGPRVHHLVVGERHHHPHHHHFNEELTESMAVSRVPCTWEIGKKSFSQEHQIHKHNHQIHLF